MTKIYSYIIKTDLGFAPNPHHGFCTLATCKPGIRRGAQIGDWVVGISPKKSGNKIVYVMEVSEKVTISEYFNNPRFELKKPYWGFDNIKKCGDNIYRPLADGGFEQLPSYHSFSDQTKTEKQKRKDINGKYVLISYKFRYFGIQQAFPLEEKFGFLIAGRFFKNTFSKKEEQAALEHFSQLIDELQ